MRSGRTPNVISISGSVPSGHVGVTSIEKNPPVGIVVELVEVLVDVGGDVVLVVVLAVVVVVVVGLDVVVVGVVVVVVGATVVDVEAIAQHRRIDSGCACQ